MSHSVLDITLNSLHSDILSVSANSLIALEQEPIGVLALYSNCKTSLHNAVLTAAKRVLFRMSRQIECGYILQQ